MTSDGTKGFEWTGSADSPYVKLKRAALFSVYKKWYSTQAEVNRAWSRHCNGLRPKESPMFKSLRIPSFKVTSDYRGGFDIFKKKLFGWEFLATRTTLKDAINVVERGVNNPVATFDSKGNQLSGGKQ